MNLAIYNLLGQKICTLLNAPQAAGRHQVVWDGKNDAGVQIPNGVYFYRIQVNAFMAQRKLILMR